MNTRIGIYLCIGSTFFLLFFDPQWLAVLPWGFGLYLAKKEAT